MTPLADKITTMTAADLKTLRANAARLLEHGSPAQMSSAGEILPLIDTQLAVLAEKAASEPAPVRKRAAPKKKVPPATGHQTALPG
ncbi:MAG: hypothetical protein ACK4I0_04760 [Brevundimonas sp.]|jgi:hypothetical protein|uniref:hypothetical protein n=1 Tax=Brevundimonas sp. TaxID=1871086 RepID=UPI00391B3F4D